MGYMLGHMLGMGFGALHTTSQTKEKLGAAEKQEGISASVQDLKGWVCIIQFYFPIYEVRSRSVD